MMLDARFSLSLSEESKRLFSDVDGVFVFEVFEGAWHIRGTRGHSIDRYNVWFMSSCCPDLLGTGRYRSAEKDNY
jgi:hypothetical protein